MYDRLLDALLHQYIHYLDNTSPPTYDAVHCYIGCQDNPLAILLHEHIPSRIRVEHSIFVLYNMEQCVYNYRLTQSTKTLLTL